MPEIPQNIQKKAGDIQDGFNTAVIAIRSNGDLTPEARLRRLAQAWTRAEQEMGELRHTWQGTSDVSVESLTKRVFGNRPGTDALSMRNADDRASELASAEEALRVLQRALVNDDDVLARAVALHAFERRNEFLGGDWAGVVDAYAAANPDVAEKILELATLRRDTLNTSLSSAFIFSIHKPQELENVRASAMDALLKSGV
jgi:hypothetical protein